MILASYKKFREDFKQRELAKLSPEELSGIIMLGLVIAGVTIGGIGLTLAGCRLLLGSKINPLTLVAAVVGIGGLETITEASDAIELAEATDKTTQIVGYNIIDNSIYDEAHNLVGYIQQQETETIVLDPSFTPVSYCDSNGILYDGNHKGSVLLSQIQIIDIRNNYTISYFLTYFGHIFSYGIHLEQSKENAIFSMFQSLL